MSIELRRMLADTCMSVSGSDAELGYQILVLLRGWGVGSGLPSTLDDPTANEAAAFRCIPANYRIKHLADEGEFARKRKKPWWCTLISRGDSPRVESSAFDCANAALAICAAALLTKVEESYREGVRGYEVS